MRKPPTPHDALFKRIFSDPRNAADQLRAILPPATLAALDLESLRLMPGSFVDDELRSRHTDLLFSVKLRGRPALIYVLFEHQSTDDRWMPLRLVRYLVRIWDAHLVAHEGAEKLPVVIPIVIQHDPDGWKTPLDLAALVDLPEDDADREALAPFIPRFAYLVDDLSAIDTPALRARVMSTVAKLALAALRDVRSEPDLDRLIGRWKELLEALREPSDVRAMDAVFRYIMRARPATDVDHLARAMRVFSAELSEQVMSTAQQLIEQGIEQGIERGIEQGRRAMLLRQLARRFGELPAQIRARVDAASSDEIDAWADAVLEASSLDDLFGEA